MKPSKETHNEPTRPKKSLGQNFLTDPNYLTKIAAAVEAKQEDSIIEIGPGRGALTELLLQTGAKVIAIELDRDLIGPLRESFSRRENFHLIERDALTVDFSDLLYPFGSVPQAGTAGPSVKLAANLPYYISTAVLRHIAAQREIFTSLILMFQREVVHRITARAGNSERGYLTVLAELAFDVQKLFDVPPAAFWPAPKVWSSVVKLTPKPYFKDEAGMLQLVSAGFAQKRKTIANNLKAFYPKYDIALRAAEIDPKIRAEALTLDEWQRLYRAIAAV
ncbi:MAG: ribosomal RNA small subunit methyltransferase A [Acidobacteria bacterium]|nr:ribosomal RNA small subunit methyltransferase A [Acidobacteriota bacterium]